MAVIIPVRKNFFFSKCPRSTVFFFAVALQGKILSSIISTNDGEIHFYPLSLFFN